MIDDRRVLWSVTSAIVGVAYTFTAFPNVAGGDSGEIIAEACVGGVAHPVRGEGINYFRVFSLCA